MTNIRLKKVETRKDLNRFIRLPWAIYKNDPNWVPPLILDVKEKLNRKKNPFFEHAEMDLFLAVRGAEITGRIAAIIDHNHNRMHAEKTAFFGMYESLNDPDIAKALLDGATAWAKERGMTILRGPMNLSMNEECAFILDGFDSPPMVLMPYNPPYYLELMSKCGLFKAKDLYAYKLTQDSQKKRKSKSSSIRSAEPRLLPCVPWISIRWNPRHARSRPSTTAPGKKIGDLFPGLKKRWTTWPGS